MRQMGWVGEPCEKPTHLSNEKQNTVFYADFSVFATKLTSEV